MSSSASSNKRLRRSNSSSIRSEASTSISSSQNRFKYDVFISFRGEDTRNTFVGHLYEALKQKGIYTYKDDDKIEQGKTIDNQLVQAIKDSRFFIVVFSENYASSSWCLDELVEIMECQKTGEQTAYPVFFHVEPTQVRKQSGVVKEVFAEHENKEAAGKWREAMKEASNLAGWELKARANGHEAEFIKKIVGEISLELRSISFGFDEKLVGMETRVKDVVSSLDLGADEVCIIGIKGMGGAGKTTTVRAVFDYISNDFEAISFVGNVREVSNGSVSGLKNLQEQVLSNVLNEQITLDSVDDGKNMMKKRMCGKKVLLVLDDVDHIDQLEALAGGPCWFKPGSRVIVTTRDEQVLVPHRVNLIRDIHLLSEQEAFCLFRRYAFVTENPAQGFKELSEKVVRYAAGLPLTIKVLGSFLCGKEMNEWEDAIERLNKIPLKETLEKLELSYIGLEDDYKEIFLDIACILKGKKKEDAIRILECCGFHARNGLKVLEQRSLITISSNTRGEVVLGMHDHLEEMGINIVRREHPNEPSKHSRLWINEEIEDTLANDMGTEATRSLKFKKSLRRNLRIGMKGLIKMKKLQYLEVNFPFYIYKMEKLRRYLEVKISYYQFSLPNSLRYLKCDSYPFLYLPKTFQADNLVGIEMNFSRMVQLRKKVLKNLKFLSLAESKLKTFDFRITPNLETLSLKYHYYLVELCMPVACQKLKHLDISFSKLKTFELGLTPNLETLSLECSRDLKELCMPASCQNLTYLHITESKLRTFDLGLTPNLETLSLDDSSEFVKLHVSAPCPNLKILNLDNSRLRSLDLELIPNLERLALYCSRDLKELCMPAPCQKLTYLRITKSKLRTFDLGLTPNLETLSLFWCTEFVKLEVSAPCPNLKILDLSYSRLRSLDLELIPNLEKLDLKYSKELVEINAPFESLKKVVEFNLNDCALLEKLPEDVGRSGCLETLNLQGCAHLEKLPEDIGQFGCLKKLNILGTRISHLPQSIFELKGLIMCASEELLQRYNFPSEITTESCTVSFMLRRFVRVIEEQKSGRNISF